jgi:hypothetical protein
LVFAGEALWTGFRVLPLSSGCVVGVVDDAVGHGVVAPDGAGVALLLSLAMMLLPLTSCRRVRP